MSSLQPLDIAIEENIPINPRAHELYQACIKARPIGYDFTTHSLLNLGVAKDSSDLRNLCQGLLDLHLFAPYTKKGSTVYRTRSANVALKLYALEREPRLVYSHIEGAGRNGVWKKTLIDKTNFHENTVSKNLKELLGKQLIKEFKASKNAQRRMFILYDLEPTEETTGGTFYNDGELDEALVNALGGFIISIIEAQSWLEQTPSFDKVKKSTLYQVSNIFPEHYYQIPKTPDGQLLIHQPPGFENYPLAEDILKIIDESDVIKGTQLALKDIKRLLKMLVFDGKLIRMENGGYKSIRRIWTDPGLSINGNANPRPEPMDLDDDGFGPGNGLTGVPCDRCPISRDCRPGGLISPQNCKYMEDWLKSLAF